MSSEIDHKIDTLANAQRLLSDSRQLLDAGRGESAVLLAVLALEELGKHYIARWGRKNQASSRAHPTHIEKQAAAFLVLSAREMVKLDREMNPHERLERRKIREYGPMSEQLQYAKAGFFEDLRHFVTYSDKEPKWPREFRERDLEGVAREIQGWFQQSLDVSRIDKYMGLAAIMYENGLGDL